MLRMRRAGGVEVTVIGEKCEKCGHREWRLYECKNYLTMTCDRCGNKKRLEKNKGDK
jgi:ribosomal protein L32